MTDAITFSSGYEPIAVIGMDCHFPQADSPDAYWRVIAQGRQVVQSISAERSRLTGFAAGPSSPHRWGGWLDQVDGFDADLFKISPREAASLDPQQRLLLETAWRALEDAHIPPHKLVGTATGVYIGIIHDDYCRIQRAAGVGLDAYSGSGNAYGVAANRISYTFGLQGPSVAVDTACSSSLVTLHQACQALGSGEINLALAGGVNLVLSADYGVILSDGGLLSPTGACHAFDARADGYVRGEGCGIVVLKRLCDAERDGDRILAVVRGSAVNQNGHSNGMAAPNRLAQQQLIQTALQRAGFAPETVGYVETFGAGTALGDMLEAAALRKTMDVATAAQPCWLGAVKSNIGHLEAASGVAGFIKAVLVLQHGQIPPLAGFQALSPKITLDGSRLRIPPTLMDWPMPAAHPRRAGVSSFGFGGTNAHVLLEAVPPAPAAPVMADQAASVSLLVLSAHSPYSLKQLASRYAEQLHRLDAGLADLCRSAHVYRTPLQERAAFAASDAGELIGMLEAYTADAESANAMFSSGRAKPRPRVAFLFTGQGCQYPCMGRALYRDEPVFRSHVDQCDAILTPLLGQSVRSMLLEEAAAGLLAHQCYSQPAIVVMELALARLWQHYGVEPKFVLGHSVGEYAAAHVAGAIDLPTTLRLIAGYGHCVAQAPETGAMLAVLATQDVVPDLLATMRSPLEIAAVNALNQVVLSGHREEIERVAGVLAEQGIRNKRLQITSAFHSRLMEPILGRLGQVMSTAVFHPCRIPMLPTGGQFGDEGLSARYLVEQVRLPVLFHDALQALVGLGADTFVEIGPRPLLSRLGARTFPQLQWLASVEPALAAQRFQASLGALFVRGVPVRPFINDRPAQRLSLPAYPFDHAPHWFKRGNSPQLAALLPLAVNTLVGRRLELALPEVVCFGTVLPGNATYLIDHRVSGHSVMPGSGYASLMVEAAREAGLMLAEHGGISLRTLRFVRPLVLEGGVRVQTILRRIEEKTGPQEGGHRRWLARVMAWVEATQSWELHAAATLCQFAEGRLDDIGWHVAPSPRDGLESLYAQFARRGLEYGLLFRAIRAIEGKDARVRAEIELPPGELPAELLSPILLDAAFQILGGLLQDQSGWKGFMPLPAGINSLDVFGALSGRLRVEARLTSSPEALQARADIAVYDEQGINLVRVSGLQLTQISLASLQAVTQAVPPQQYQLEWFPAPPMQASEAMQPLPAWGLAGVAVSQCNQAFFIQLAGQPCHAGHVLDSEALARADFCLSAAGLDLAPLAGLILYVEPLAPGADPVDYCLEVCTRLQRILIDLDARADLPQRFPVCLMTLNAGNPQAELPNMPVRAGLNALWRSAAQEYTRFALRHIGMGPRSAQAEIDLLLAYLNASDETEMTIRHGAVQVPRLTPWRSKGDDELPLFRADASYLVTGGASSLGLALADWLAAAGAGRIVLVSRRRTVGSELLGLMKKWGERGITVVYQSIDVSVDAEVAALCASLARHDQPLRGVFHAAGGLDDRPLSQIDRASWEKTFSAKARAACLLDRHTRSQALDMFVLFSSAASTIGSSGQCNYAAACGMLDALASARRRQGLCASVINWGPWADIGLAASDPALLERLTRVGLHCMAPFDAFNALRRILSQPVNAQTLVVAADWTRFGHQVFGALLPSVLRNMATELDVTRQDQQSGLAALEALGAMDNVAALAEICRSLRQLLAQVLRSEESGPLTNGSDSNDMRLAEFGIDSLMAMELRNRVKSWANVDLPAHSLIGNTTLGEVAELIHEKILLSYLVPADSQDTAASQSDQEIFIL